MVNSHLANGGKASMFCSSLHCLRRARCSPTPPHFFFLKFNLEASLDCRQSPYHFFFPGRYKNASGPRAEMAHSELRSASAQLSGEGGGGREMVGLGGAGCLKTKKGTGGESDEGP